MLLFVIWKNPLKGQKLQGNVGKSRFCQCVGWQHFVPLGFLLQTFLSRRLQTHFLKSRLAGCLSAGFFRSHPTQFESSLKEKAASHRPFFCCPDRAFAGNPHHGNSTIPNCQMCTPLPLNPNPPPPNPTTKPFTNSRDSSLIPASARRSPPSPSPRYRPHAESSHHEAVRRCTARSTRWSLGIFVVFFLERKTGGEKPPGKTRGV